MSYVVWEWQNDLNIFLPYSSEVSTELEDALANNIKELMLGTVDPYLETFKVNIPQMTQITTYNGRSRTVRRTFIDVNHPFARGIKWEWNFRADHWFPYGAAVAEKIQEAVDGAVNTTLQLPALLPGYTLDVNSMVQTNNSSGFQRKMRKENCIPYQCPVGGSRTRVRPVIPPVSTRPPTTQPARPTSANKHRGRNVTPQNTATNPPTQPVVAPPSGTAAQPPQPAATTGQPSTSAATATPSPTQASGGPGHLPNALKSIIQSSSKPYQGGTDVCPVCQNNVSDQSDYTTDCRLVGLQHDRITLNCNHHLHTQCLHAMISASNDTSSFRCLECQKSYGVRIGNQPVNGKMAVKVDNSMSLAGYEQYGTIILTYSFNSGVQDGVSYSANNFPRVAYIPDNDQGNDIVDLLKIAFKRRLVFTIGTSVTTGQQNCVVWNDIHHKTSTRRGDAYGYPDPGYLDRITAELKSKGVE